jgi:type IV secretory pathway TraG/TraD family ATPase VirD4
MTWKRAPLGRPRNLDIDPGALRAAAQAAGSGIYLGVGSGGWAWAGAERSTLVLGPSRSGKTSSLIIPNVLAAPGAVVSTSTKPDVLLTTAPARSAAGWTMLYDPSGTIDPPPGVTRIGWSPVNAGREWDGAMLTADSMVRAARGTRGPGGSGDEHWAERAASLLAPLLHAAALHGEPMATVLHWVDRHQGAEALAILADRSDEFGPATDVLAGILSTDSREQSGIWSTTSGVLGAYRSSAALASTEPPFLDAKAFCANANTLYICATGRHQQLLAPMVVGLLVDVRDAAYRRARDGSASPPVLAALDEVANIAPIPDLPAMVSEGAGQGLLTLACLQDLSQARSRWGREADAFPSLFGATVVLGGVADMPTLEALSALGGDHEVATRTVGAVAGADGRVHPSTSVTGVLRRRLPVDVLARGLPGAALALDARNRAGWVTLTPAHRSSPWRELVAQGRQPRPRTDQSRPVVEHHRTPTPGRTR